MIDHLRVPKKIRIAGRKMIVETRYPTIGTRIIYAMNMNAVSTICRVNTGGRERFSFGLALMIINKERNPITRVINLGMKAGLNPADEQPEFISTPAGIMKKNITTLENSTTRPESRSLFSHLFI